MLRNSLLKLICVIIVGQGCTAESPPEHATAQPRLSEVKSDTSEYPTIGASDTDSTFFHTRFEVIHSVEALPSEFAIWLPQLIGREKKMANPDEPFNPSCIVDSDVPSQRLMLAGISERAGFISFEQGGFAHVYVLVLFRRQTGKSIPEWLAYLPGPIKTLPELKTVWESSQILSVADLKRARENNTLPEWSRMILKYPIDIRSQ